MLLRLIALAVVLLVAGCTRPNTAPVDPPQDPTNETGAPAPHGPGSISGMFYVKAPALYIDGASAPKQLAYGGFLCAFHPGDYLPVRHITLSYMRADNADPYLWKAEFNLSDLPLGTYRVKLARIENPDWDIYWVSEYFASEEIELTEADQTKSGIELRYTDPSWGPEGEISGDLLLHGIEPSSTWFSLDADQYDEQTGQEIGSQAHWNAALPKSDHGRVGYRIAGLSLGKHVVEGQQGSSWRVDSGGRPFMGPPLKLTAAQPKFAGYDVTQILTPIQAQGDVELNLTWNKPWEGYLELESRRVDGRTGPNDVQHYFIYYNETGLLHDWIGGLSVDGEHIFSLYHLGLDGSAELLKELPPLAFESYEVKQTVPPSLFIYPGTYYRAAISLNIKLP